MLPTKFRFIQPCSFRGEDFQKSTNQKQELHIAVMFVIGSRQNEQSSQRTFHGCFLPNVSSFCQEVSEEKNFRNQSTNNKNCLWWEYLLTDRDKMSNHYRELSIDASYHVSVHLAKRFQRIRFKCEKLTGNGCQVMAKAHLDFGQVS